MIRGVRGAVTVEVDQEKDIITSTEELFSTMIKLNKIDPEMVASVFISTTEDITAAFPAKAIRNFEGWTYVPVMCMREMDVSGAISKCIRVMIHVNTEITQKKIQHVYLRNAIILRPDLSDT